MFQNLTGWHALIILAAVMLLFGAAKLPALARSVGQSVRILKTETRGADDPATTDRADAVGRPAEADASGRAAGSAHSPRPAEPVPAPALVSPAPVALAAASAHAPAASIAHSS